jgi:hypothetical protein
MHGPEDWTYPRPNPGRVTIVYGYRNEQRANGVR